MLYTIYTNTHTYLIQRLLSHSHFSPSKADLYLATKIASYLEPEVRLRPGRTDLLPGVDLLRIGPDKLDRFI